MSSIVLRDNDEIVRRMDSMKDQYLEAERKENKPDTVKYKSAYEALQWLINESE